MVGGGAAPKKRAALLPQQKRPGSFPRAFLREVFRGHMVCESDTVVRADEGKPVPVHLAAGDEKNVRFSVTTANRAGCVFIR